jgi:rare lipoprotein A
MGLSLIALLSIASLGTGGGNPHIGSRIIMRPVVSVPAEQHFAYATWYGPRFFGRTLACGRSYVKSAVFAAHRTYPLGTRLRVTNLHNHRSVIVAVEDRGPYSLGRDLDLSYAAARKLRMMPAGVVLVSYSRVIPIPSKGGSLQ